MDEDTVFMFLIKKINEDIDALKNDIIRGNVDKFEIYKFCCGRVDGLMRAKDHIIELKERLEREDD